MRRNDSAAFVFRLLIFLCAVTGTLLSLGVFSGRMEPARLRYFSPMFGAFCAVYYLPATAALLFAQKDFFPRFRGALLVCAFLMTITRLLLLPADTAVPGCNAVTSLLLYCVVPVLMLLDWGLFEPKGQFRWVSPLLWVLVPDAYYLALVLGSKLGRAAYPYAFLQPAGGVWPVARDVLILNVLCLAFGYLLVSLDIVLNKNRKK